MSYKWWALCSYEEEVNIKQDIDMLKSICLRWAHSSNKDLLLQSIPLLMVEELSLTVLIELIKTSLPQRERIATELRIPLARRHLEIILSDPGRHPLDLAVAGQEPPAQAEAPEGGVEVGEGLHWQGVHGVAVQRQQCQGADPGECVVRQHSQEVEAEIKDLEGLTV